MTRWTTSLALLAVWTESHAAAQNPTTAVLAWSSTVECGSRRLLEQETAAILGRDPFHARPPATFRLEVRLDPADRGVAAEIRMLDDAGQVVGVRRVEAPACGELVRALAIVVAMMIESPERESTLVVTEEGPSDLALTAGASVVGMAGASAPALVGGGLLVGARARELGLDVQLRLEALAAPVLPEVPVAIVGFRSEAGLCLDWGSSIGRIGGCVCAGASWFSARGVGFDVTHSAELLVLDVGAGARGAVYLGGPFALRAELDLLVPLLRSSLEALDPTGARIVVWEGWPVVPALRLEVIVELPELSGTTAGRAHSSS